MARARLILFGLAMTLVFSVLVFLAWAADAPTPMPEAIAALASDAVVQVDTARWLVFRPTSASPKTGFILYPGARVDARAYAPAARAIAAQGYLAVIVPMPLNLAIFGADRAADVMAAYPEIEHWAVGGHSMGGSMAASFVRRHADRVQGLVLWASYPAITDDLSSLPLVVASVYGTADKLATVDDVTRGRMRLPPQTRWVAIEGGNHAQFGWYGPQAGDRPAAISREAQQQQTISATLAVLRDL